MPSPATERVYRVITSDDEGRVCRDIPEALCDEQPGNFVRHVVSLTATKTGDGLMDPKLVLAWLLSAVGAPAWQVGLLVPIRESLALLPQLVIAGWIRARPKRKRVWAVASFGQAVGVLGMAGSAAFLDGPVAGGGVLVSLAFFALCRSAASVSYKDVLGKTVSKATRGTATGSAGSAASTLVLLFGVLVSVGVLPLTTGMVTGALLVAAALWVVGGATFLTLAERPGATGGGGNALRVAREQVGLLREDPQLIRFIAVRGLLLATALAPPYMLALSGTRGGRELGALGPFVIAASAASVSSSWIWGRFSDRSSRRVLIGASAVAAVALAATAAVGWADASRANGLLGVPIVLPALLYLLMVAYQGVRVGRSTHIVDMADEETRAAYTALSNTAIGVLLLVGSAFGALAQVAGKVVVLAAFAAMCGAAAAGARGLEEVQKEG